MEEQDRFRVGDLVVVTLAAYGVPCTISSHSVTHETGYVWLYDSDHIVGQVMAYGYKRGSHGHLTLSRVLEIFSPVGWLLIWEGSINSKDLCVVKLTPENGAWLNENCEYSVEEGKHKLKRDLVAVSSFGQVAKSPFTGANLKLRDMK